MRLLQRSLLLDVLPSAIYDLFFRAKTSFERCVLWSGRLAKWLQEYFHINLHVKGRPRHPVSDGRQSLLRLRRLVQRL